MTARIVIIGGGFGGLAAASALGREDAEVVVIDKQNHHLFQPLLYQVATVGLSPADIAWPIRRILRRQKNARAVMATVTGVDTEKKRVLMAFERAEIEDDSQERERLLTFVVVGGGPTGVEMAGAISEVARKALSKDFRCIDPRTARVLLVEAGQRLLSTFAPKMSEYAKKAHTITLLGLRT